MNGREKAVSGCTNQSTVMVDTEKQDVGNHINRLENVFIRLFV